MADLRYQVVINHEEQYSIVRAGEPLRRGWKAIGVTGDKKTCLDHIEEVWTDMRPAERRRIKELLDRI
jgi:MbtH protein